MAVFIGTGYASGVSRQQLLVLIQLWALALGCTYYVDRGSDLYNQGRYIEAAHVLEKTEARLTTATHPQQAAYGLYRGATLLKLGDLDRAELWLGYARKAEIEYPGSLTPAERELLREELIALRVDLDRRSGASR